jgi:hypothetical protein
MHRKSFAKWLLCFLLVCYTCVGQATAQTITIGSIRYDSSWVQPGVGVESAYELLLNTDGVTLDPIPFQNVTIFVKGGKAETKQEYQIITTGLGCGNPPFQTPCDLLWLGGTSFQLPACAKLNAEGVLVQDCVSIAVQFESLTGTNASFFLADGVTSFCTYAYNTTILPVKTDQMALDPDCGVDGFCKGTSVPVVLHAAPAKSCNGVVE